MIVDAGDSTTAGPALDRLCTLLEEELERQHVVLAVVEGLNAATKALDFELVRERTTALALVAQESLLNEQERVRVCESLADSIEGLDAATSLSQIAARIDEPYASRLRDLQVQLRAVLASVQATVRGNRLVVRNQLGATTSALRYLAASLHCVPVAYDAQGQWGSGGFDEALAVNQQG